MDKNKLLLDYISYIFSSSNKSYEVIGRSIKIVRDFIKSEYPVSRKGYRDYIKANAAFIADQPYSREALCEFLEFNGCGYSRTKKVPSKPLERLKTISDKNSELLNQFIYYLTQEEDYSPNTLSNYSFSIKKFFEYANEVSVDNYKRFVAMLENYGYSPQTIRLRITALERFSKWLKKPIELKRPKFKRSLNTENVPDEKDYKNLLEYLQTEKNGDLYFYIKILATTGARVSEFLQFTWEDILNGEVTLKGKGNKYRRFFFNKQLQREVEEYVRKNKKAGYVAIGKSGRLSARALNMSMKKWGVKCGIDKEKMHPHAFRHFFAKMFLKKNKDVIQLADLLGHGSVDTTRIYLQKSYEEQKKEFNRSVTW